MLPDDIISKSKPYKIISCVYFLISNKEIVYVGITKDLHSRLRVHKNSKEFDRYYYIEEKRREKQLELEYEYIKKLKPKLNKTTSNTGNVMLKEFDDQLKQRVNMDIDEDIWKKVSVECAHSETEKAQFVDRALRKFLKETKK
jgi:predicted GIY-YIG superfamily endonuclease